MLESDCVVLGVFPQSPLNSSAVIVFKEFFAYPCVYIRKFKIYTYTYTN